MNLPKHDLPSRRHAVIIRRFSAGTAFATRIAVFTSANPRPFSPIACSIALRELATAANP